jgi:hypothetical protein
MGWNIGSVEVKKLGIWEGVWRKNARQIVDNHSLYSKLLMAMVAFYIKLSSLFYKGVALTFPTKPTLRYKMEKHLIIHLLFKVVIYSILWYNFLIKYCRIVSNCELLTY